MSSRPPLARRVRRAAPEAPVAVPGGAITPPRADRATGLPGPPLRSPGPATSTPSADEAERLVDLFLAACCVLEPDASVGKQALLRACSGFLKARKRPLPDSAIAKSFADAGFSTTRRPGQEPLIFGIKLSAAAERRLARRGTTTAGGE